MIVGTVKEIKTGENRVGLTPQGVRVLVAAGHTVLVENDAGRNSGFSNLEYREQGAVLTSAAEVWQKSDMVVKVKEPVPAEYGLLRNNILFTYLHLAAEEQLTRVLLERSVTGIAYETVELDSGELPLLTPMSEVAGRMAVQVGAHYLEKTHGGSGLLLAGVPGVEPANVTVLGSGIVSLNAAKMALGMGANVTMVARNLPQLRCIDDVYHGTIRTLMSNSYNIEKLIPETDLLVSGVLITGAAAPKLVTRSMVKKMKPGSVIVDVAIDQGGSVETARPTTHHEPVYVEEGVIHYCVTNMPGAVPHTSTLALTNATLPYVLRLADGFGAAMKDKPLARGVNTCKGMVTHKGVADAFGMDCVPLEKLL